MAEEIKSIRVRSGITVEVNDAGETIVINVEDQNFIDKFYDLLERLQKTSDYANSKTYQEQDEHGKVKAIIDKTKDIMGDIDLLFGEGACRKVFGDIIPNPYLIADFMYQLEPFTKEYADSRQKMIATRYNTNRRGGKK